MNLAGTGHRADGLLLVDDVLTTGGSLEALRASYLVQPKPGYARDQIQGAVMFARGECPTWIKPVFQFRGAVT